MDDISLTSMKTVLQEFKPKNATRKVCQPLPGIPSKVVHERELNDVFFKVQSDIEQIKNEILSNAANDGKVDYDKVKLLFERAEKDIQQRRQDIVAQFNHRAITIPASTFLYGKHQELDRRDKITRVEAEEKPLLSVLMYNDCNIKDPKPSQASPGQKLLALQKLKSIINPARPDARSLLYKHYGVPQSNESKKHPRELIRSTRPVTGSTVTHTPPGPKATRINARLTPPPATADDARKGVLNLIDRKVMPAASQLSISPSPIKQKQVVFHHPADSKQYRQDLVLARPQYNPALVRFDESSLKNAVDLRCKKNVGVVGDRFIGTRGQKPSCEELFQSESVESQISLHEPSTNKEFNRILAPLPTPSMDLIQRPSHKFVIQNGNAQTMTQDFIHFEQYYCLSWGSILTLLQKIEKLMTDYSIPIAFVDGDRLADLALFFEVGPKPTIKDLLMCIINSEDVEKIILIPGRRYMAPDGIECAAIKIQSMWHCHEKHTAYIEYRKSKWAAGIIALTWIMKCKITMIRHEIKENNQQFLYNFRQRAKLLKVRWSKLKNSKRVVIHIPSLGYETGIREPLDSIAALQNSQIGRICDIRDPNVEVIYICPVSMTEELHKYYMKLISIMCSVTGQDHDVVKERLKILTPDHHDRFPEHNLSLTTLLKYSTNMMRRIKTVIKGKQAYIVPGIMHKDDLYIANELDIPIFGTEPELAHLYSMKSGVRRIFESAGVTYAPGENDVYSMQQVHVTLARLVTENLHVTRWLFKIDNQFDGRGTAYCDVAPFLCCYQYALKEEERYGEKWMKKWAHEPVYNMILKEIPDILGKYAKPVDKSIYPTWEDFIISFLSQGGIIEACPPCDSVTAITANILIEPDGHIQILSVSDQIHSSSPYKCWGHTIPQTSIDAAIINKSILLVGSASNCRGIVGYCSVDFVTFIDPKTDAQELWAVGLNLSYSSSYALIQLMSFLTNGELNVEKNMFQVAVNKHAPTNVAYRSKRKRLNCSNDQLTERLQRYCVLSSNLFHTNLNNIHYSVFFQMCKAHGIGYDDKLKLGTTFTLVDHVRRESMGMLTVGETLQEAVSSFALNLSVIHEDISSPSMQGETNFQGAINDLKSILNSLQKNSQINQQEDPTSDPPKQERLVKSASASITQSSRKERSRRLSRQTRSADSGEKQSGRTSSIIRLVDIENSADGELMYLHTIPFDSSMGMNCIDNRFPSSPVSNYRANVKE